ncbi:hypothetical protein WN55_07282 [Dufourea novaeangliae]|uniref:Uncharacterized protein n=1 Tax=Dufourea novaeangliae TaxID=178035 RepID=A0A154PRL1_DUFNO|nr:hypothetical protein WN55_07282 [Dufourea novaeangliae]
MKCLISRMTVSSMTDRRIEGALLTRRAVKNALSSVRRLCGRLHRGVRCRDDMIERQNRVNETGGRLTTLRMHLDEEELRNLRNENLENELREVATKIIR